MDSNSQYYDMGSDILNRKVKELEEKLAKTKEQPTLRDQFAMAALSAIIMNKGIQTAEIAAETAYQVADAMIQVRMDSKRSGE